MCAIPFREAVVATLQNCYIADLEAAGVWAAWFLMLWEGEPLSFHKPLGSRECNCAGGQA